MKKTRRVLSIFLAAFLCLTAAACGGSSGGAPSSGGADTPAGGADTQAGSAAAGGDVKAVIEEVAAGANWDEMVAESGIVDTITEILPVEKDYTIRIGTPTGGRNEQNYVMALFEAYIEATTAGKVQVELYPASQLGTATQMIQGVLDGSITGVAIPLDYFYTYAPASGIASVPFMFPQGSAQAARIFTSDSTMDDYLKSKGLWPVAWLYEHSYTILADRAINAMSDFKGMKIWCLPSVLGQMELEAYGASPTLMDPSEIALSMQNGTVDGAYTGVTFFNNQGLQDSAAYLNKLPMKSLPCVMMFGAEFMTSLPDDLREHIQNTGRMIIEDYEKEYVTGSIERSVAAILEVCEENIPSEDLLTEMKEATKGVHEYYKNTDSDCAAMYEKMTELIAADEAAGGTSLPY